MTHSLSWSSLRKHVIIAHTRVCLVELRAHVCLSLPPPTPAKKQLQHMRFQGLPQTLPVTMWPQNVFVRVFWAVWGVCMRLSMFVDCVCVFAHVFLVEIVFCCVCFWLFVGTHLPCFQFLPIEVWGTELAA